MESCIPSLRFDYSHCSVVASAAVTGATQTDHEESARGILVLHSMPMVPAGITCQALEGTVAVERRVVIVEFIVGREKAQSSMVGKTSDTGVAACLQRKQHRWTWIGAR